MRILVTGATGFVGSVLLPQLVARHGSAGVSAFVLPEDAIPASWARSGAKVIRGDVVDAAAVARAVEGHSHVIHLAGFISYWRRDRERLMRVNRDGVGNVVEACLRWGVQRLVHVSSVGAVGFHRNGTLADETTPFNWPHSLDYMVSKHEGQRIVERAARERGLPAIILNPASIMGPGDHDLSTPHNQLYRAISRKRLYGSFSGGLAVVDVRDLTAVILTSLVQGKVGESYLIVGANLRYAEVIRLISRTGGRRAYPFPIPASLLAAAGGLLEIVSRLTNKRPLLTYAYGQLSGWRAYYSSEKSCRDLDATYLPVEKTIEDTWEYFRATFGASE